MLSQKEIDALLEGLRSGEVREEELLERERSFRVYDFRRPTKFSKDNLRTIHLLHETFARQFANMLTGYLRLTVRATVESVEQLTFEEFLRSLSSPTYIAVCSLGSEEKPILVEVGLALVFSLVDRMLGGPGVGNYEERELTEIETAIMEEVMTQLLIALSGAWSMVTEVNFRFDRVEFRPQFAQVIFPNEIVLNVCVGVNLGPSEGFVNLCLPYTTLEDVLDELNAEKWLSTRPPESRPMGKEMLFRTDLSSARVELVAELGRTRLRVSDLRHLQVGQVIRLNRRISDPISVRLQDRPAFAAIPGTAGRRMAVQITRVLLEDLVD
ncbi:MAG: flagellar motor switch protein FliM [Actinomycetota bacterium]|nr:flagellar motor switch protein FliM [Actinomycetota bacterium]MDI7252095.1 flagellar motor switch protein FliM [Actinomycetota bacterium]